MTNEILSYSWTVWWTCYMISQIRFCFAQGCFDMCVLSAVLCYSIGRGGQPMMDWLPFQGIESSWNVMAHGDTWEGKWRGNWQMEWVASTLHTTLEHGVLIITTADAHTSAASSQLNWRLRRFKWTHPFCQKTKSGFFTCAITFQTQSTAKYIKHQWVKSMLGT